jgi:cobalt-precorrin 5A hydrolase
MKTLNIGIGCRSNSSAAQIEAAVLAALGPHAIDQVRAIATIDTKAREAGLLEFCVRHALPLLLFSRAQIAQMPVATPSAAVREHLGVDGVCEPCALLAASCELADSGSGAAAARDARATLTTAAHFLVDKTRHAGITVAIAVSAITAAGALIPTTVTKANAKLEAEAEAKPDTSPNPPNTPHQQDLR